MTPPEKVPELTTKLHCIFLFHMKTQQESTQALNSTICVQLCFSFFYHENVADIQYCSKPYNLYNSISYQFLKLQGSTHNSLTESAQS